MTKYQIRVKRDWGRYGWYDAKTRTNRRDGFVVTDGSCNIIPGAGWFETIEEAMVGIEAHRIAGDTAAWHGVYKQLQDKRRAVNNAMGG